MKKIVRFLFKTKCLGMMLGFLSALASSTFLSIYVVVRSEVTSSYHSSIGFLTEFLSVLIFWGFIFACIPAGLGGWIIESILRKSYNKGTLTAKGATKTGIVLAGLAGIATSGVGILVIMLLPHGYWRVVVDEIQQGYFFVHFYDYFLAFLHAIAGYSLEILLVIAIACLSGGLTGWVLAKQILYPQIIASLNRR